MYAGFFFFWFGIFFFVVWKNGNVFLAKATSHNNRLEKNEGTQHEKYNVIITNWVADKRNDRPKYTSFTWWKFREFVTNTEQTKRGDLTMSRALTSQPLETPSSCNKQSAIPSQEEPQDPQQQSCLDGTYSSRAKMKSRSSTHLQNDFSILSCLFEISSHHTSMNSANTASAAFHQLNWQGQNF